MTITVTLPTPSQLYWGLIGTLGFLSVLLGGVVLGVYQVL